MIGVNISHYRILEKHGEGGLYISCKATVLNSHLNIILLLLFFIILSPYFYTQQADLPFEHLSVDEGMPTVVNYIFQDKIGYLWFATNSGIYKYDGYNFTSYKNDLNDPTSLIDNTVTTLYEDEKGIMWIGTWLGLEKFDRIKSTFKHYIPCPSDTENNTSNNVWTICEDKFGILWIGTGDGLYEFDKLTENFISLRYDDTDPGSISHNVFGAIYKDKEDALWFGTQVGLDKLNFNTGKFIHYWIDEGNRYKSWDIGSKYRINTIIEDNAGLIWLGTNRGLVEFNPHTITFSCYLFNPGESTNRITSISQDVTSGNLWLASWGGLFSFDKKTKKFTNYNSQANVVCSEHSGTLWIGTNYEIKKLNRTKQPFKKYPINNITNAIMNGTDETLWVFTFEEWWKKFDIRKEKFVPYSFGKDFLYYVYPKTGDQAFLKKDGSFYIRDTLNNIQFFSGPFNKQLNTNCTFGWKTNKGYYVGSSGSLYLFEPKTNKITEIKNFKDDIYFIFEDSHSLIWIATYMGRLYCYNQEHDTINEFISGTKNLLNISRRQISQIYEDKKGRLWFGTINGLSMYERSTKSIIHFTEKDGLPSNNILYIVEDNYGYLWLNTSKGISKFDPETNHFKNYDASYGLEPPTDAYYGFGCKTKNGEMYFPGSKGITRFHPDSIKDNPFIPPVVITSFKVFDKPHPFSEKIYLPYNENFISFEFAALSYISPERNLYAYKMEGIDNDWVYSGTRRYASYPNLESGKYTFHVKGSNNDGVWNEAGTSALIIISPPWWKTTYANISYSLFILSLIYFTWKMKVKRIKISHEYEMSRFEAEKLHEVDEMKSRFFTNISHEFRTPLTLILGPVKQIIERTKEHNTRNELKIVHKNANKLLGLVNELLDISKLESGNMKLQTCPQNIIPLLKALLQSFCSYAERKRITIKFKSSENEIIVYIDKDKFEKIFTNILSNAFKFTAEGGEIEVTAFPKSPSKEGTFNTALLPLEGMYTNTIVASEGRRVGQNGFVEISIHDNGIGISKDKISKIFDRFYQVDSSHTREQEGTGIGLSLTKELVELHKGKIEVESEEGKGTIVNISLPLGKEHLKPDEICEQGLSQTLFKEEGYPEELIYLKETKIEKFDNDLFTINEKPYLLIVEDNLDVRNYIINNLNNDYRILEAIDGEDGWNKSINHIPDLVVSDVMMPRMDGFKLCNKLKTDERTSHIPIILLTAKAASSDKLEGFETGADDYIMKPFDTKELKSRIKNLIEQRKRIHEHFRKHGLFEIKEKNITSVDQKFLQNVFDIITQHVSNSSFSVDLLVKNLSLSRSVVHRKILSLVGETPGELIRSIRIKTAAKLIEKKFGNLSEIALEAGFNNPAYFSECFKKQYGMTPSQYQQKFAIN